jgi:hypothetical protein
VPKVKSDLKFKPCTRAVQGKVKKAYMRSKL